MGNYSKIWIFFVLILKLFLISLKLFRNAKLKDYTQNAIIALSLKDYIERISWSPQRWEELPPKPICPCSTGKGKSQRQKEVITLIKFRNSQTPSRHGQHGNYLACSYPEWYLTFCLGATNESTENSFVLTVT